ncbi:GNAT family N-acetyltransferase [Vibrio sp. AK197]|uniref:GNAT family N-acetyltransferase n=1 Tax=Vibrio olivae TaxID=1243002 RepID=A0ABV5HTL1_9VIBR
MQGFRISTDRNELDFDVIYQFISQSYWAKGIPKSTMQKALDHSLCFGVFNAEQQQVGFARLITDYATFAYLSDVFIVEQYRGCGLSKFLIETVVSHPDVQGLRRMMLATSDAHGLYAQYGFKPIEQAQTFMQVWQPNIYQ